MLKELLLPMGFEDGGKPVLAVTCLRAGGKAAVICASQETMAPTTQDLLASRANVSICFRLTFHLYSAGK